MPLVTRYPQKGGSAPTPTVQHFAMPLAFDTPGLATGIPVTGYTPQVGDIILMAWFAIDTAWDGTTPTGDIGTDTFFTAAGEGLFLSATGVGSVNMGNTNSAFGGVSWVDATQPIYTASPAAQSSCPPTELTTTDTLKVCVSQTGTPTGGDPGSTQGAGVLHLIVLPA